MPTSLRESPYSVSFNILFYLGAWASRPLSSKKLIFYCVYQIWVTFLSFCGIISLLADLFMVSDNFEKLTWNLCITTLFTGGIIKNITIYVHYPLIRGLRHKLHKAEISRKTAQDQIIHEDAVKRFKASRFMMYATLAIFGPVWLGTRYFTLISGKRELPIPIRLPVYMDPSDTTQYNYFFVLAAIGALLGIIFVLETELCMYGLMIQISREYDVLIKDIPKLGEIYERTDNMDKSGDGFAYKTMEVDSHFRKTKTRALLKQFSSRQRTLVQYTKDFEKCYHLIMLLQFVVVSVLIIVSAIQGLLVSGTSIYDMSYQMGYLTVIIIYTYTVCWCATRIQDQCINVGVAAYSTPWYLMDIDFQKEIKTIIHRSQNPPRLTAGKAMDLNVNTFMNVMKNIYSWLTLFRQLEIR